MPRPVFRRTRLRKTTPKATKPKSSTTPSLPWFCPRNKTALATTILCRTRRHLYPDRASPITKRSDPWPDLLPVLCFRHLLSICCRRVVRITPLFAYDKHSGFCIRYKENLAYFGCGIVPPLVGRSGRHGCKLVRLVPIFSA